MCTSRSVAGILQWGMDADSSTEDIVRPNLANSLIAISPGHEMAHSSNWVLVLEGTLSAYRVKRSW